MLPFKLISTGVAVPSNVVSSTQLDGQLGLPPGTVAAKSGIVSRRFAPSAQLQSELAALAVQDALSRAQMGPDAVDLLLSVSGVPQQALPSTAAAIAQHLALPPGTPAFDVNASCIGFMAGLQVAGSLLQAGQYRRIVLVASDMPSRGVDWEEPEASLIFGDGAACAILERGDGTTGLRAMRLETHPEGFSHCEVRAGGTRCNPRAGDEPRDYLFRMEGKSVFKLAMKTLPPLLSRVLHEAQTSISEVAAFVPHQASHLGMAHVIHRLGFPQERVVNIYPTHGNQVSASIPTALHAAHQQGLWAPGNRVLLLGTAAGFTAGAAVLDL